MTDMNDRKTNGIRFDMLPPAEMADKAALAGVRKVQIDVFSELLLSILAGVFIGIAANFYTITLTGAGALPFGVARLLGGLAFSLGLILVVIAGAELFTGNNLIVMAVLSRKVALRWLLRNWILVYVGNFAGSLLWAWLVWTSGQNAFAGGQVGQLAVQIAAGKCVLPFGEALVRGILCNALVCLAVWLCFSARSATDRILAIIPPITAFVACGFEHCVANMYFVPLGLFAGEADGLTWGRFFLNNLLPVTLGNIVGGALLVGVVFWVIYQRRGREPKYRDSMI
jgi:formate/nitrite transporter